MRRPWEPALGDIELGLIFNRDTRAFSASMGGFMTS
jgi:hypothetical protein